MHCWWQCKMMQLLCERVWHFLNLQHRITTWPSDSTSSYGHKGSKAGTQKDICTATYTATSFTTAKKCKQGKCPSVGKWISKVWCIHRMEYLLCFALLSHFSCVQPFVTPWTIAHQAPLFLGFSRQEYWSGLPFPSLMIKKEVSEVKSLSCIQLYYSA